MRIGIDGRELLGDRTGVGWYLAYLCVHWAGLPDAAAHQFVVYAPEPGTDPAVLGAPFDTGRSGAFAYRHVPGGAGTWWEQRQLPAAVRREALDVFFAPAYAAPLRIAVPVVVTLHDLSFVAHPEWFTWREGLRRRWLAARTVARADAVITVSEFSRQEILRYYNVPPGRVHAVRSGVNSRPAGLDSPTQPSVLYVGSLFNRRHLPTLIEALAKVRAEVSDAELVIVGADRTYPKQDLPEVARLAGVEDHVALRAYVPEDELDALYRGARVFAFLSEYEGFGMTPLEALSAGVPIVVGDTPVARELYLDAAVYVPPDDTAAVAAALVKLLTDPAARDRARAHATTVLARFSWRRAAAETLTVLERAAGTD